MPRARARGLFAVPFGKERLQKCAGACDANERATHMHDPPSHNALSYLHAAGVRQAKNTPRSGDAGITSRSDATGGPCRKRISGRGPSPRGIASGTKLNCYLAHAGHVRRTHEPHHRRGQATRTGRTRTDHPKIRTGRARTDLSPELERVGRTGRTRTTVPFPAKQSVQQAGCTRSLYNTQRTP